MTTGQAACLGSTEAGVGEGMEQGAVAPATQELLRIVNGGKCGLARGLQHLLDLVARKRGQPRSLAARAPPTELPQGREVDIRPSFGGDVLVEAADGGEVQPFGGDGVVVELLDVPR